MRLKEWQNAIGATNETREKKTQLKGCFKRHSFVAAVLTIAIALASLSGCRNSQPTPELPAPELSLLDACALAQAVYPSMTHYPISNSWDDATQQQERAWQADRTKQAAYFGAGQGLESFFSSTVSTFLSDGDGENLVYSPLNLYMALAMLAETADGNSRAQILDVLGVDSIETLRTQAHSVWNANYCDDGVLTTILASSLWIEKDLPVARETVDRLANTYYTSTYQGDFGSEEMNEALRMWIDQQTGGFLEEQIKDLALSDEAIMAIVTTLYFRADWTSKFSKKNTADGVFHASTGDVTIPFMRQTSRQNYYWGEHFSAVAKSFSKGGSMWLLLPDEGVSVDDLLNDSEALGFVTAKKGTWENQKQMKVHLSMPKFDVGATLDLSEGLKQLGIADCFDVQKADFSAILPDGFDAFVSEIEQRVRVSVDEEGAEGASVTIISDAGAAPPPEVEEIDFVLDRPFLFVITGQDGLPLFVGTVKQP